MGWTLRAWVAILTSSLQGAAYAGEVPPTGNPLDQRAAPISNSMFNAATKYEETKSAPTKEVRTSPAAPAAPVLTSPDPTSPSKTYFQWRDSQAAAPSYFPSQSPGFPAVISASALLTKQDFTGALAEFNKAIATDAKLQVAYVGRGFAYLHLREFNKALKDLDRAVEIDPRSVPALLYRANTHINLRAPEKALADFNKVLEIQPAQADAINGRGVVFAMQKKHDLALKEFDKATALNPKAVTAYLGRASIHLAKENKTAALAEFRKVLEIEPGNVAAIEGIHHITTFKPGATLASTIGTPMQVVLVRAAQSGCEPACQEWISAEGTIDTGTPAAFERVLGKLGKRKLPVFVHSLGGSVTAGLEIGRMMRTRGLDVAVTRTVLEQCAPADAECATRVAAGVKTGVPVAARAQCGSACAFILAGGKRRLVGELTFVGVHQLSTYLDTNGQSADKRKLLGGRYLLTTTGESAYKRTARFFTEMGIGESIMPILRSTPNDELHWLTKEEMHASRIVTDEITGEQLIAQITTPSWTVAEQHAVASAISAPSALKEKAAKELADYDGRQLTTQIHRELERLGCDTGETGAKWGPRTKRRLDQFVLVTKSALATNAPSPELLSELKNRRERVCSDEPRRPAIKPPVERKAPSDSKNPFSPF